MTSADKQSLVHIEHQTTDVIVMSRVPPGALVSGIGVKALELKKFEILVNEEHRSLPGHESGCPKIRTLTKI